MPEIDLEAFDDEYRRAEVEHAAELESMLPELEKAAAMLERPDFPFFSGDSCRVVDIGCGIGILPMLLAQQNPRAQVVGVDVSQKSIEYAKAHHEPRFPNLSYQTGSVDTLSEMFSDVDMITCVGALHHFPDLQLAIDQIMGALGPKGIFFLSDLNRENIHSFFSEEEIRYLDSIRKLPEKARNSRLRRQGYTHGQKMRRFLTLMSFNAAYTPAELAEAFGGRYGFKGRMAGVNYLFTAYRL